MLSGNCAEDSRIICNSNSEYLGSPFILRLKPKYTHIKEITKYT